MLLQAFKPAIRRRLLPRAKSDVLLAYNSRQPLRRQQHSNQWAHKEYFQTPGQAPLPDTTPYQPGEYIETALTSNEPSRLSRALRSLGWIALFNTLGVAAGVGFVSWQYMQPPYEPDSPEELEILEEIEDLMKHNPVAEDLRQQGWIEEEFYSRQPRLPQDRGTNLVRDTLRGSSQTLNIKTFKNPTTKYTMVLFFVGFGLDGFPDVMHGGITATVVLEAAARHLENFHRDLKFEGEPTIVIDYKQPIQPGEVYSIMLPPATVEPYPGPPQEAANRLVIRTNAFVLRLDHAPKIEARFNPTNGRHEHTVEIASATGYDPQLAHATVMSQLDISIPAKPLPVEPTPGTD